MFSYFFIGKMFLSFYIELKLVSIGKNIVKKLAKFFTGMELRDIHQFHQLNIKTYHLYKNIKIKFKDLRKIFLIGLDLNFWFLTMFMKANKKLFF